MKNITSILFLFLGLLFSSCGDDLEDPPKDFQFVTRDGILVYTNGLAVSETDLETLIDIGISKISSLYSEEELQETFSEIRTTLTFVTDRIPCTMSDGTQTTCAGLASYRHAQADIEVVWHPCLASTSIIHELVHVWLWYLEGDGDSRHQDNRLWSMLGVVGQARVEGMNALCPPLSPAP